MTTAISDTLTLQDILDHPELVPPHLAQQFLEQVDPVAWVIRHLRTEKHEQLEFHDAPFLVDYLRDFYPNICVKKGSQIRFTTTTIAKALFYLDNQKRTGIYTFPTATEVRHFSAIRFKNMVRSSEYIQKRMKGIDNTEVKQIGESTLYFRGSQVEKQAISIPSDMNIHDELDFSNPEVKDIYSSRLASSKDQITWEFSTPTLPKYGISRVFEESDQRYWMCKCTRCNTWQTMRFPQNMKKKRKRNSWYWGCWKCDKTINRRMGKWIAKYPRRTRDGFGVRGYHIGQPSCPFISAQYVAKEYKKSINIATGTKRFHNFNLGLEYESGESKLSRKIIFNNIDSPPSNHRWGRTYIGIDQGDMFHVIVTTIIDGRRWIYHLEKTNRPERIKEIISSFNPTMCVLDALPNTHTARDILNSFKGKVHIAFYNNQEGLWNPRNPDKSPYEILINRTDAMDNTTADWVAGRVKISNQIERYLIEEFSDHMENVKRDIDTDKHGQNIPVWKAVGPDHYRHADLYNYIAFNIVPGGGIVKKDFAYSIPAVVEDDPTIDNFVGAGLFNEKDFR